MKDINVLTSQEQTQPQPVIQPINPLTIPAGTIRQRHFRQTKWQTPTLLNSWVDNGDIWSTTQYMKDPLGFVHVKGLVKSGTIGQNIFVLPAGYRPLQGKIFSTDSVNAFGELIVKPDGSLFCSIGNNIWVSLDCITFFAEA